VISCPLTSTKLVICTITVVPPSGTHAVDASLSRAGKLYGTSHKQTRGGRMRLRLNWPLTKGRYTLTIALFGRHGHRHTITRRLTVT
jgi:hypothetical protein